LIDKKEQLLKIITDNALKIIIIWKGVDGGTVSYRCRCVNNEYYELLWKIGAASRGLGPLTLSTYVYLTGTVGHLNGLHDVHVNRVRTLTRRTVRVEASAMPTEFEKYRIFFFFEQPRIGHRRRAQASHCRDGQLVDRDTLSHFLEFLNFFRKTNKIYYFFFFVNFRIFVHSTNIKMKWSNRIQAQKSNWMLKLT
jgi:hypothetical protein